MAADDYLNAPPDPGFPTSLDGSSSLSGNRPASGARRATPGEVLSQGFQGAQNAGDFLGLDTEFTASQDPNQAYGTGNPLDLVPPPTTGAYPDGYVAVPEPAPLPAGDAVQEYAEAPSAFEFGEDLGSEESALGSEPDRASKTPLVLAALAVAGLVAGGVMYGPSLYERYLGSGTEVARTDDPGWQEKPTRPKAAPPADPATQPSDAPPAADPVVEVESEPLVARGADDPSRTVEPRPTGVRSEPQATTEKGSEPSSSANSASTASVLPLPTGSGASSAPRPSGEFPDLAGSAYEWASEDQLELIWRGSDVPLEAVRAPAKTLMPRVGNVRVFSTSGDVFEGRLYAVGQGLVWLDGGPGRVGLDGDKVERIEVLPPPPAGTQVATGSEITGGRRVRVKVPGGMLYGSVLKSDGDDVTLALETGGRVRVKAADVQDLGSGRAIVVSR